MSASSRLYLWNALKNAKKVKMRFVDICTEMWYNVREISDLRKRKDCFMTLHIGMRKIKSLIALVLSFVIWQIIRIFLPMLEVHPLFAYIYSVIEIRDTAEKTKKFGKLRIKATIVGLVVGLIFITASVFLTEFVGTGLVRYLIEFLLILMATLVSLVLAENMKCESFCGIAAIITIICMVSHNEEDIYLYAIMRVIQTLIGVLSATAVNVYVGNSEKLPE